MDAALLGQSGYFFSFPVREGLLAITLHFEKSKLKKQESLDMPFAEGAICSGKIGDLAGCEHHGRGGDSSERYGFSELPDLFC